MGKPEVLRRFSSFKARAPVPIETAKKVLDRNTREVVAISRPGTKLAIRIHSGLGVRRGMMVVKEGAGELKVIGRGGTIWGLRDRVKKDMADQDVREYLKETTSVPKR